jgi:hypothetical protein
VNVVHYCCIIFPIKVNEPTKYLDGPLSFTKK